MSTPIIRQVPVDRIVSHEVMLDSAHCSMCGIDQSEIQPGETRYVNHMSQVHFRAEGALPVEGVEYSAFDVIDALVGSSPQWPTGVARPALNFLRGIRGDEGDNTNAFDMCKAALSIRLGVTNRSDKPARFAVKLVGRALL